MILILFALIVPVTADSDYYAVKMERERYKIFTKFSKCNGAVYQSGDNRVLFQDEVWKIGTLKNDLTDCNALSSVVEDEFRSRSAEMQEKKTLWDMTNADQNGNYNRIWIWIKGFNKGVEVTGLQLVGGTKVEAKSKDDCLRTNWGKQYHPDKHIVVAFKYQNCFYDLVDEAELVEKFNNAKLFVHPAGKNEIKMVL